VEGWMTNGSPPQTNRFETSYADMAIQFAHMGWAGSMNNTAIDMGLYAHACAILLCTDLLYPDTLMVVAEKDEKRERYIFCQRHHLESESSYPHKRIITANNFQKSETDSVGELRKINIFNDPYPGMAQLVVQMTDAQQTSSLLSFPNIKILFFFS